MKSIILPTLYLLAFLFAPTIGHTQSTKEYYSDGKLLFKGEYALVWSEIEREDWIPSPSQLNREHWSSGNPDKSLTAIMNLFPDRKYEGKCTFYYPNGKKWLTGNYKFGVKQGKFNYWYDSGQLAMERYYENGMAIDNWKTWDENGKMSAFYSYKPIPEKLLKDLNQSLIMALLDQNSFRRNGSQIDSIRNYIFRDFKHVGITGNFNGAYQNRMPEFEKYIEDNLFKKTIWEGPFKVWEDGQLKMEFYYSNNQPVGTWKLFENGKLAFEISFKNGKFSNAKEYEHPEYNEKYTEQLDRRRTEHFNQLENMLKQSTEAQDNNKEPNAIDPNISKEEGKVKIYRNVEQLPRFICDVNKYLADNVKYPKEAFEKGVQGKVAVEFVILPTGKIDTNSITILRGLGYGTEDEVKRVIKAMPDWKPGMQNGKAVSCYYMLTINFFLQ